MSEIYDTKNIPKEINPNILLKKTRHQFSWQIWFVYKMQDPMKFKEVELSIKAGVSNMSMG